MDRIGRDVFRIIQESLAPRDIAKLTCAAKCTRSLVDKDVGFLADSTMMRISKHFIRTGSIRIDVDKWTSYIYIFAEKGVVIWMIGRKGRGNECWKQVPSTRAWGARCELCVYADIRVVVDTEEARFCIGHYLGRLADTVKISYMRIN